MSEMASDPKAVVLAAFAALGRGDVMAIGDYLADDVVWEIMGGDGLIPGGWHYEGRDVVVEQVLTLVPLFYDVTTISLTLENTFVDGSTVILEFSNTAVCVTGAINDGARYVWVFTVDNGKIVKAREYLDSLKLQQLFFPADAVPKAAPH